MSGNIKYILLPIPIGRHKLQTREQLATLQLWDRVKYTHYFVTILRKQFPNLIPEDCPYCDRLYRRIEAHHDPKDNYLNPRRVAFMCDICHREQKRQPKRKREPSYSRTKIFLAKDLS